MKKILNKLKSLLPTKRRLIQLYSALLFNANIKGFFNGRIYQGKFKAVCTPGLNCYSCPGASGACPLGSLQNALGNSEKRAPYYIFGIILLYGIILGRTICGLLCPFGLIQDLLYKIKTPKLKKSRFTKILSYLKYVILVFFVIIVPVMYGIRNVPLPGFCKYICPAGTIEGAFGLLSNKVNSGELARLGPLFTWKFALAISIVLGAIFIYRIFCRFLCPLGALYGLFNKIAILGIKLDKPKCIDCGLCISKCKMDISEVGDHECINCGECVDVCPTKAISWRGSKVILPPDDIAHISDDMSDEEKAACIEKTENVNKKLQKRRKITKIVAAVVAVAVINSALIYYNFIDKPTDEIVVVGDGDVCPSMSIPIYDGAWYDTKSFDPAGNQGKVTVINFWGVWCTGCIKELPYFDRVAEDLEEMVTVVAIHTDTDKDQSDEYINEHFPDSKMLFGLDRPIDPDDPSSADYFYSTFGGPGTYPITVIISPDGTIFTVQTTELDYDTLMILVMGANASSGQ